MNNETTMINAPDGPILTMTAVGMEPNPAYDVGLEDVSLTMQRGDLALVRLEHGVLDHPFADVVSGLTPISQGTLRVFGYDWAEMGPDAQARARWRIGRVFGGHGWMSNLDVDENVTLAERYHGSRSADEILAEAMALAQSVGLPDGLPEGRPAVTHWESLRRSEWVRAALGSPWLCIFERPGRELGDRWLDHLMPLVQTARERGSAVIWMCEGEDEWRNVQNPSLKLRAKGNKLIREE